MIFSRTGRYAIRALAYMAGQTAGAPMDIQKLRRVFMRRLHIWRKFFKG
jgi:DNA-binding IscR family transcriptional regulator